MPRRSASCGRRRDWPCPSSSRSAEFAYTRESWEDDAGLRVHVEAFLVDVEPGWEPVLNSEHVEYRWLGREEAAELLFWPEPAALLRSLA